MGHNPMRRLGGAGEKKDDDDVEGLNVADLMSRSSGLLRYIQPLTGAVRMEFPAPADARRELVKSKLRLADTLAEIEIRNQLEAKGKPLFAKRDTLKNARKELLIARQLKGHMLANNTQKAQIVNQLVSDVNRLVLQQRTSNEKLLSIRQAADAKIDAINAENDNMNSSLMDIWRRSGLSQDQNFATFLQQLDLHIRTQDTEIQKLERQIHVLAQPLRANIDDPMHSSVQLTVTARWLRTRIQFLEDRLVEYEQSRPLKTIQPLIDAPATLVKAAPVTIQAPMKIIEVKTPAPATSVKMQVKASTLTVTTTATDPKMPTIVDVKTMTPIAPILLQVPLQVPLLYDTAKGAPNAPVRLYSSSGADDEDAGGGISMMDRLMVRLRSRRNQFAQQLPFAVPQPVLLQPTGTVFVKPLLDTHIRLNVIVFWTVSERLQTHESDVQKLIDIAGTDPVRTIVLFLRGSSSFPTLPPLVSPVDPKPKQGVVDALNLNVRSILAVDWDIKRTPIAASLDWFWNFFALYLQSYNPLVPPRDIPIVDNNNHLAVLPPPVL